MNNQVKVQLGVIIFIIYILVYYYILPDYTVRNEVITVRDYSSELFCKKSKPAVNNCESASSFLKTLRNYCGLKRPNVIISKTIAETNKTTLPTVEIIIEEPSGVANVVEEKVEELNKKMESVEENIAQLTESVQDEKPKEPKEVNEETKKKGKAKDEARENNLIYQIIVIFLVVSVIASITDCIQERRKRRAAAMLADPNNTISKGINGRSDAQMTRRMSLADLTMSRHARRESQASYRPPDLPSDNKVSPGLVRRSSSHDTPVRTSATPVCRQVSCPQQLLRRLSTVDLTYHLQQQKQQHHQHQLQRQERLEDGAWAEKRRVRMIQRH